MSAVTTQTFSISLTGVPASELNAETVNTLWQDSLGPVLNGARTQQNADGVTEGTTILEDSLITYNRGAATLVRQRQWTTLSAAQEKVTWLIDNIPSEIPDSGPLVFEQGIYDGTISFTHVSTVATDDQSLSQTGFITNP
jgi:hypothetical protein